jgi:hypothetical protein
VKMECVASYSKDKSFAAGFVGMFGNFEDLPDIAWTKEGVRGGAFGCDTALQVGKSRV